jgi:hypothetical protein
VAGAVRVSARSEGIELLASTRCPVSASPARGAPTSEECIPLCTCYAALFSSSAQVPTLRVQELEGVSVVPQEPAPAVVLPGDLQPAAQAVDDPALHDRGRGGAEQGGSRPAQDCIRPGQEGV